jgi:hypothetical protein
MALLRTIVSNVVLICLVGDVNMMAARPSMWQM